MASSSKNVDAKAAQKRWQLENKMDTVDTIYSYDKKSQQDMLQAKPWDKEWVRWNFISGAEC